MDYFCDNVETIMLGAVTIIVIGVMAFAAIMSFAAPSANIVLGY